MKRSFVDTEAGQMHYRTVGNGPTTVLLLHQALRSSLEFKRIVPLLDDSATIVCADLMGYGDSDLPRQQLDVPGHATCVHQLVQALELQPVCLLGHHTGANVALELAASCPEDVDRLILSGPAIVKDEEERSHLVSKMSAIQYPDPAADGSHLQQIWEEGLTSSFGVPRIPRSEPELLSDFFLEQIKAGPRRREAHIAAFSHDALSCLAAARAPVLLIVGDRDMWACYRPDEVLKMKPDTQVITLPTAGEAPRLMPEEFARAIKEFLPTKSTVSDVEIG